MPDPPLVDAFDPALLNDLRIPDGEPIDPSIRPDLEAALLEESGCPLAVREALTLPDGRVAALVGRPGSVTLADVGAMLQRTRTRSNQPGLDLFAFVLLVPGDDGWSIEAIPYT